MGLSSRLSVGQRVHGVIIRVRPFGLDIELPECDGFLPLIETEVAVHDGLHRHYAARDEIDAWIKHFGPGPNVVTLTLFKDRALRSAVHGEAEPIRPGLTWGQGVPYWELYMLRTSKKSWRRP